ncbi:MAG: AAA family ATPase [Dehalococcoidia bacterium]
MAWGIIGQERAVTAVQHALAVGTAAHAYLFVGPARVGKATLAIRLAQALNCTGDDPPCQTCQPCRRIEGGIHADVQVVTVEASEEEGPQHKDVGVDQIRAVERTIALNTFEGRALVVIIDPADAMTIGAQNAFLKTLEEPPPHVAFVLVAVGEERLLPTIRSRCRRVEFRLMSLRAVEEALLEAGGPVEESRRLARLSRGRLGWALAMSRDESRMKVREQALDRARALGTMTIAQRLELAERLASDFRQGREAVLEQLLEWQSWWRDLLLVQSGVEEGVANLDLTAELREDAGRLGREEVVAFLRALSDARRQLAENVQPRLALEALMLEASALLGAGRP